MSKTFRSILFSLAVFVLILQLFNESNAQDLEVTIKFDATKPEIVTVEGKRKVASLKPTSRNLSFLTSIAGQAVSDERISNLKLFDSKGAAVGYKRFIPGEYVAESEFVGWSYQVDLSPPKDQRLMARISWMTKMAGELMLDDLLPQVARDDNIRSAKVIVTVSSPKSDLSLWPVYSSAKETKENMFFVSDIRNSIFFVGSGWKEGYWVWGKPVGDFGQGTRNSQTMYFLGEFEFDHVEARDIALRVYEAYEKQFGSGPSSYRIAMVSFPDKIEPDVWEAETRGSDITILTSGTSFKSQTLQQLHEQLRHEMFHLWIPNGVNLTGNYDWFYEGFALYQSLKTGVALNRIRFDDYLDTLSRAYDIDKRLAQKLSLIDVSKNRWSGDNNTRVYVSGMLVAFLCDLALLEKSKGKRSVTDILRKLYEKHRPPIAETDGNAAVLALLRSYPELTQIIDRNITGSESVDWNGLIKVAGLEADANAQTTSLKVTAKPNGRQKDLLDKLGYNNWRKLASK